MAILNLQMTRHHPLPWRSYAMAVVTGILLALSFPKPGLSLLAWGAFVPLLWVLAETTPRQAFRLGFSAGFVAYAGIVYWLTIVMNSYGKLSLPVSLMLTLVMAAYLALYPAVACALVRSSEIGGVSPGFSFPVVWVGLEYLRSFALTGFPWASLGYSQYRTLPLIQIADLVGVYGVSFLIVLVNVALFRFSDALAKGESLAKPLRVVVTALVLMIVTGWYGFQRLNTPEPGEPLRVALIQGNISQDVKWNPSFQEQTVSIYERLTRSIADFGPQLVVWPESATPFFFQTEGAYADRIKGLAKAIGSPLLFGSPAVEREDGTLRYLNSAFLVSPSGNVVGRTDKVHLVPFGEYVPLKTLLPFVNKVVEGIGDFSPGRTMQPLEIGRTKIGVLICYEGIFPTLSREYVREGARLLVNISNDAWYKRSSAPYQHLSMTVFRAVENRVPLIRATNTGITAIIDSRGHLHGMTPLFKEATLTGEVRPGSGDTFYDRVGDLFAGCCLALTLLLGAVGVAKTAKRKV